MRVCYIDHFDSFTNNLIDWLSADIRIQLVKVNCDDKTGIKTLKKVPMPTILSPGPGSPLDYPLTKSIIDDMYGSVPFLCICLGHQILATWGGCKLTRVNNAFHGTTEKVRLLGDTYQSYSNGRDIVQTAYNSLAVDRQSIQADGRHKGNIRVVATNDQNDVIGICTYQKGASYQAFGWQLHPESFLARNCDFIRDHFVDEVVRYYKTE